MGLINDFQKGYRDGQAGKYNFITIVIIVFVALYFIQKWTNIPVFDWAISFLEWLANQIMNILGKILNLITKS